MRYKRRHDTEEARTFAYLTCLKATRVDHQGPFRYAPSIGSTRLTLVCLFFVIPDRTSFRASPFIKGKGRLIDFLRDRRPLPF